jgi:hypothetical protein
MMREQCSNGVHLLGQRGDFAEQFLLSLVLRYL